MYFIHIYYICYILLIIILLLFFQSEPLKNLNSFIEAQLEYHKRCYEILSELSPEINELELNNEAMLREKALSNQ